MISHPAVCHLITVPLSIPNVLPLLILHLSRLWCGPGRRKSDERGEEGGGLAEGEKQRQGQGGGGGGREKVGVLKERKKEVII